jgi:hypothetical protein
MVGGGGGGGRGLPSPIFPSTLAAEESARFYVLCKRRKQVQSAKFRVKEKGLLLLLPPDSRFMLLFSP